MEVDKIIVDIANVRIDLPETKVLIDKTELESLRKNSNLGNYLSMSDILQMLSVSRPWLLENVLLNQKWRNIIDISRNNNGFVKYPKNQGGRYLFLATKSRKFFEENFSEILKETWYNDQDKTLVIKRKEVTNGYISKTRK